jgi:hypothetical protein
MNGAAWTVNCPKKLAMYKEFVDEMYDKHKYVTFEYKLGKPRSIKQNNAMWVFCRDIAKRCNEVPLVAETIIRHLAEKYGLYVSFPTKDFKNGNKT